MTLTRFELNIVRMLRRSAEPLSGRQVANVIGVAPNTANRMLKSLQASELVTSSRKGRATLWTTTADVAGLAELEAPTQDRVVLVVTAVDLEHTEVRNRLVNTERIRVGDIWMVRGEVPGDNIHWTVFLARAGMGNATSAALVGVAAGDLNANFVAFVGTAAGLKSGDQRHLDVVVASRIHNPYAGKQIPSHSGSKLLGRDKSYAVPAPLLAMVNACIADSEWTPSTRSQYYSADHPHAFVAPIASVEAVQTDPNSPVLDEIRARFQDAAALDMESFGLAAGSDIHDLPVLAVRGISDFIGDKPAAGNDELQPQAAGNAAGLLRDILIFAHPDDFKRGRQSLAPTVPPNEGASVPVVPLPGAAEIWMTRLESRSPARANAASAAIAKMRGAGVTAATWLSRAIHRPPVWLREDDTGDGWALMTTLASIAGSRVAWRGFDHAAAAARLTGDDDSSRYFSLISWLERIGNEQDGDDRGAAFVSSFDAIVEFYCAVTDGDLAKSKSCAEIAIASLGLKDLSGVLRAPAEPIAVITLDTTLRDLIAAAVLRQIAQMMLSPGAADQLGVQSGLSARMLRGNPVTRDLADDALRLAQWAVTLRPNSEGTLLTHAQATLGVLVSLAGRTSADVEDEVSKRARLVEADALLVRDVLREWDGSSGPALAVAARARSLQGDYLGALRLLLPAPNGLASQIEAKDPDVVRLAAYIARVNGMDDLALDFAAQNPDRVEGELMRAAVLAGRPQMVDETREALFAALKLSDGRHHSEFQALMALARMFNSLKHSEQTTVLEHVNNLGRLDHDLADVMHARILLSQGNPTEALRFVRGLERNELALEAHSDALIALGRAEDAAKLVFDEGIRRGDIPLAAEALEIASRNGLTNVANEIAVNLLCRGDCEPVRLKALRARQHAARGENRWADVFSLTDQVIRKLKDDGLPVAEFEYWLQVEALYFLGRFERAIAVLLAAPAVSFNEREKARLFLATLSGATDNRRAHTDSPPGQSVTDLGDTKLYTMFMRAAAEWSDDEQIAAAAMSIVLMAPDSALNEVQIDQFREYTENYFARHGQDASIKQIKIKEDRLDPLIDFLRTRDGWQRALEALARDVHAGAYPLAVLTEAAGRTTTEALIRRDLGYIAAVGDDGALGEQTVLSALGGRVVIDTTAVVVAPWSGYSFRKLTAHFESVILPASTRDDISRARASLAIRSTMTIGWDTREQRVILSEITAEQAKAHAAAAEQVWGDVQGLQIAPVANSGERQQWLAAITVAQDLGLPVWADDIATRRFARALGTPAFGTIDLISAFADAEATSRAAACFRDNRVVDLPIDEPWFVLASRADWDTNSSFALAISRPAAWQDLRKSFNEFRALISRRPKYMQPQQTATWTHLAGNGLAMATVPPARPKVVSALLAWVIFFADPFFRAVHDGEGAHFRDMLPDDAGRITELIIGVARSLRDQHYDGADPLVPLVTILSRGLSEAVGPETTSRIVASLAGRLDNATGGRLFAAYIQSAEI